MTLLKILIITIMAMAPAVAHAGEIEAPDVRSFFGYPLDVFIPVRDSLKSSMSISNNEDMNLMEIESPVPGLSLIVEDYGVRIKTEKPIYIRNIDIPLTISRRYGKSVNVLHITLKNKTIKGRKRVLPAVLVKQIAKNVIHQVWTDYKVYKVQAGDSLFRIAMKVASARSNFKYRDIALALYNKNRNAFIGGDINLLISGKVLQMPASGDIQMIVGMSLPTNNTTNTNIKVKKAPIVEKIKARKVIKKEYVGVLINKAIGHKEVKAHKPTADVTLDEDVLIAQKERMMLLSKIVMSYKTTDVLNKKQIEILGSQIKRYKAMSSKLRGALISVGAKLNTRNESLEKRKMLESLSAIVVGLVMVIMSMYILLINKKNKSLSDTIVDGGLILPSGMKIKKKSKQCKREGRSDYRVKKDKSATVSVLKFKTPDERINNIMSFKGLIKAHHINPDVVEQQGEVL